MLSHFSLISFFVCQTYTVIILKLCLFETENSLFQEIVHLIVVLFTTKSITWFIVCLYFFWCSCIEAPLCTKIVVIVKHVFKRKLNCLTQLFNCFLLLFFYHVPPIFLDSDSIYFGAFTSPSLTFVDNGKDVLSYNLHSMGGICKEGWL